MSTPHLILVHGSRASRLQWDGYDALLPDCTVVTPDLPGHGTFLAEPFTWETAEQVIADAVAAVPAGSPCVVAGHSLGGFLALSYAARHPGTLHGLGLIGASADPTRRVARLYARLGAWMSDVAQEEGLRWSDAYLRRVHGTHAAAVMACEPASMQAIGTAWQDVVRHIRPWMLARVPCPSLVLTARLDQLGVDARRYAYFSRDVVVERLPAGTHLFPVTHPQPTAEALARLVERAVAYHGSTYRT